MRSRGRLCAWCLDTEPSVIKAADLAFEQPLKDRDHWATPQDFIHCSVPDGDVWKEAQFIAALVVDSSLKWMVAIVNGTSRSQASQHFKARGLYHLSVEHSAQQQVPILVHALAQSWAIVHQGR